MRTTKCDLKSEGKSRTSQNIDKTLVLKVQTIYMREILYRSVFQNSFPLNFHFHQNALFEKRVLHQHH